MHQPSARPSVAEQQMATIPTLLPPPPPAAPQKESNPLINGSVATPRWQRQQQPWGGGGVGGGCESGDALMASQASGRSQQERCPGVNRFKPRGHFSREPFPTRV